MAVASPPLVRLGTVDSTQARAFALAAGGALDGTAVVADHQTAGRGRRGRRWEDVPGASLLVSIILRPRLPATRRPLLTYAAGLATAEALGEAAGLVPRLKWPNDVLAGRGKVAGVLLESRPAEGEAVVVVGVGINLAQRSFPPELAGRATSVALETGTAPDRDAVLAALLRRLAAWRERLDAEGFGPLRERWLALADTVGREVVAGSLRGTAVDLDADGALLVRTGSGLHRVVAGEVEPAAAGPAGALTPPDPGSILHQI